MDQREYFYEIDAEGRLFHDGSRLTDTAFLDFFFKRLKANDTGQHPDYAFVSPCGRELNFVRPAISPIVFGRRAGDQLVYGGSLAVPFDPGDLRFSPDGGLYHRAPVGGLGRLSTRLLTELSPALNRFGPLYSLHEAHTETVILPLDAADLEEAGIRVLQPRQGNGCFGCGPEQPNGLGLSFLFRAGETSATTYLTAGSNLQGAPGWMHGGFISLLLDEVMGKVLSGLGVRAPTANLSVDFRAPVQLGRRIAVHAALEKTEGRKYFVQGRMFDIEQVAANDERPELRGSLLAQGRGLFVVPRERMPE